jgi:hypothetical protein
MGTVDSFPGVKRQGHEADHSPPTNAEFKKCGARPPLPHNYLQVSIYYGHLCILIIYFSNISF